VGSPLRVHRRCEKNPMFTVSNGIAYNNLMVYATTEKPSPIGKVLGESRWISLEGEVQGKWSETEGEAALQMLASLLDAGIEEPDIFFISPFRAIATRLREKVRADPRVRRHYADRLGSWVSNRIGTVHTFQGKEAEAVVLVLGASAPEGAGARNWAGNPANLLNVAVTRAQRRLYVIGYRPLWRRAGVFRALHESLPEPLVQTDQD
jgi:AAA domain